MFTNLKMSQDGFEIHGLLWIVQQIFPVYEKIGLLSFPNTKEMEQKCNLYFILCQHSTCSWVNRGSKLMQIGANWCWMTCLRRITCVLYCLPSVTCMIYIDIHWSNNENNDDGNDDNGGNDDDDVRATVDAMHKPRCGVADWPTNGQVVQVNKNYKS